MLAALIGLGALYTLVARPYHLHWGATDAEVMMTMPGDALIKRRAEREPWPAILTAQLRAKEVRQCASAQRLAGSG